MKSVQNNQRAPFWGIWTHTRETFRGILERNPRAWIVLLAIINGIISGIAWSISLRTNYPERPFFQNPILFGVLILGGLIAGVLALYIMGWLYKVTGRWVGGKGDFTDVKCAVGWSYYPYIFANIFGILNLLTLKTPVLSLIFGLISIILWVWAFIIALKLLGEAHRFSAWRALAAVFIATVLIFVVFLVVMLIVPLLQPLVTT